VPLIDLGPWLSSRSSSASKNEYLPTVQQAVVDAIRDACQNVGFFMIKNHGFDKEVMENAWNASQEFFSLSTEEKLLHKTIHEAEYPYGYEQSETLAKGKQIDSERDDRINKNSEKDDILLKDLKETFAIGPNKTESGMPPRRWIQTPNVPEHFQSSIEAYYHHMEQLSLILLEIFALALGEEASFFALKMGHHMSALRLAHYYPLTEPKNQVHVVRAGAHTDYGALTILAAKDRGLEVFLNNEWVPVPLISNAFIVNLGDLMQRWTNDKWISTLHRVAMPSSDALEQRYSMAFFVNVNGDTVVEPLQSCRDDNANSATNYPPVTAGEHLMAKHLASMGNLLKNAGSSGASDEL
jgi:isopenicillin N synthase-like dioxygenase